MNEQQAEACTRAPGGEGTLSQDWRLKPVIDWLSMEGRLIQNPARFITALCEHLCREGAPVFYFRSALNTLHPELAGRAYSWWRGDTMAQEYGAPHGIMQSPEYRGSPIEAIHRTGRILHQRLVGGSASHLHRSQQMLAEKGAVDYVAIPLQFNHDQRFNPLIIATDCDGGFQDPDIEKFTALGRILAPILEVITLRLLSHSLLDTYLGPKPGRKVLDGLVTRGDGEIMEAAVWYSDMRDFTLITETLPLEQLLRVLNLYFETIGKAVSAYGGEILRFVGDAMLVVFSSQHSGSLEQACGAALKAAKDAQVALQRINRQLAMEDLPAIDYGVGLDAGKLIYGNVGTNTRLDFTVMGAVVNRAARIESLTKELGKPLLVSGAFQQCIQTPTEFLGRYSVKGVTIPLEIFALKH